MAVWGLRSSLLPIFVTQMLHKDLKFASAGFLVSSLTQAALLLYAGRMIDTKGRKLPLIIGTSTLCVAMFMLIVDTSAAGFFVVMFLLGISSAFLGPTPAAVVGDVVGARGSGRVVALFQMTSDFGMIVGPLVAGYLKDATGGFTWSFGMGLGIAVVAALMSLATIETRTQALEHPEGLEADDVVSTES
jgi:MFS family permease